jgi:hypothetical protein
VRISPATAAVLRFLARGLTSAGTVWFATPPPPSPAGAAWRPAFAVPVQDRRRSGDLPLSPSERARFDELVRRLNVG